MTNETIQTPQEDPQLTQRASEPKGVIRKNIKMFVYLGAIALLIVASLFSAKKKPANGAPVKGTPPQPFVQDNTANNVADLQNQLAAEKLKQQQDQQMAAALAAAQTPAPTAGHGDVRGQRATHHTAASAVSARSATARRPASSES